MSDDPFSKSNGFGEYESTAIELLKKTVSLLTTNAVDHMLISGTLLGHIRHNGFIPWDDDIDLIVHESIIPKLHLFNTPELNIIYDNNKLIKVFIASAVFQFIDLFIYTIDDNINFFEKKYDINKFYPLKQINFLGIETFIPKMPHYFLQLNYGPNYMYVAYTHYYNHKENKSNSKIYSKYI